MSDNKSFSRAASTYDLNACVQKASACELISLLLSEDPESILEPGCGTGLFTRLLSERFPRALITAFDHSKEMVDSAKSRITSNEITFFVDEAESFKSGKYDMIISNAAFHWFLNFRDVIEQQNKMLNPSGKIAFSYYGPQTYRELRESLSELTSKTEILSSDKFLKKTEIKAILETNFKKCIVHENIFFQKFSSVFDLLKNIKLTGTNRKTGAQRIAWTKKLLESLDKIYKEKYGEIIASYQVFYFIAS
ncbi:MAG: malonyl-ACP O-methyltransferase BioC [Candidatus Riflebacteria bacterium]|nr:malonyl-ACP O-methyltransferase BioC [Candidatus Riflebacteria bacterium]